jgi:hypothetical protein
MSMRSPGCCICANASLSPICASQRVLDVLPIGSGERHAGRLSVSSPRRRCLFYPAPGAGASGRRYRSCLMSKPTRGRAPSRKPFWPRCVSSAMYFGHNCLCRGGDDPVRTGLSHGPTYRSPERLCDQHFGSQPPTHHLPASTTFASAASSWCPKDCCCRTSRRSKYCSLSTARRALAPSSTLRGSLHASALRPHRPRRHRHAAGSRRQRMSRR